MSTEDDQRTPTVELVKALKRVDEKLRTARRNVRTLQALHDRIVEVLALRALRAERMAAARK